MLFEHLQARPTIQLPLDRFEPVDVPFDDALTVPIVQRPSNSRDVSPDALDEADQIWQARLRGLLQPPFSGCTLSVAHDLDKPRQVLLHGEQIRTALIHLLQECLLLRGEL